MALIDEIRQIASQKQSYNPALGGASAVGGGSGRRRLDDLDSLLQQLQQPTALRRPTTPEFRPPPLSGPSLTQGIQARSQGVELNDDGTIKAPERGLGWKIFDSVIDVIDTPRAAVVSSAIEFGDLLDGDGASFEDWINQTRNNVGSRVLLEQTPGFDQLPGWAKPVAGFVGDVAVDPLTYLGVGVAGKAAKGVGGAVRSPLDNALLSGSRRELAETVVQQATEDVVEAATRRGLAADVIDSLAAEAGQRGRGAFTTKGLQRAGADRKLVEDLGLNIDFGYRLATPGAARQGRGIAVGGKGLAEASANLKGNLKKAIGGSNGTQAFRRYFASGSSWARQVESLFINELFAGGANAATAARGLATLRLAKGDSYKWLDGKVHDIRHKFPELSKLSKAEAEDLARQIELDQATTGSLARRVQDWFQELGAELQGEGVEFGWRENYVNHVLTQQARDSLAAGNKQLVKMGLNSKEAFQNVRELTAGGEFLGVRLQNGSISEINQIAREQLGFDFLETDVRELMSTYLARAQQALLKARVKQYAEPLGVYSEQAIDEAATAAKKAKDIKKRMSEIEEVAQGEKKILKQAVKVRKEALEDAANVAGEEGRALALARGQIKDKLDASNRKVRNLESKLARTQTRLTAAESAVQMHERVLKSLKNKRTRSAGAKKAAATRAVNKLRGEMAEMTEEVSRLQTQLNNAQDDLQRQIVSGELETATEALGRSQERLETAQAAREAMDAPTIPEPRELQREQWLTKARAKANRVYEQFVSDDSAVSDAAMADLWVRVDAELASTRLATSAAKYSEVEDLGKVAKKSGKTVEEVRAVRDELRDRTSTVQQILRSEGNPHVEVVAQAEAMATAFDWKALEVRRSVSQMLDDVKVLEDPDFHAHIIRTTEDGFRAIDDRLQAPEFWAEAMEITEKIKDPANFTAMGRFVRKAHGMFLNTWKGYATATPGFIVRNAYSGFYGMYLDGVQYSNVRKFNQFMRRYENGWAVRARRKMGLEEAQRGGLEEAMGWAKKSGRYSDDELENLELALEAAAASGWGLTPQEVSTHLVGGGRSFNPVSPEFVGTKPFRDKSTTVEAVMRGAHAFDVLQRGGNLTQAISRVEKFHFNYRDITDFDRAAKAVMPFWTFFSRNMALQAEVWTRFPQKLNRSYFNFKRNMELDSDPDAVVPSYYPELGAIRTPFGERNGGTWYATPDLPSLRFRQDFMQVTGTDENGFDPLRFVSDMSPIIKVPVETIADRRLFTDVPFKNRLYDYDEEGNVIPREAPSLLQGEIPFTDTDIPIASDIIQRAIAAMPGIDAEVVNGELLMTDKSQAAIEDIMPGLGRASRLAPNQPKYEERNVQSILSVLGIPARQNTERAIQGELYGRSIRNEQELRAERTMELLRSLVP